MSKLVKQTELELKEKIMDALGRAVSAINILVFQKSCLYRSVRIY